MKQENINQNIKKLNQIIEWFENQEDLDVELGLKKVKEAMELIKQTKQRLKKAENEFEEIKKSLD
ncbi:MAG TPA: exodeoxyribonuclease VII small subunit [Candidatus Pacearchaeota archaeon]|nr:exodeoxyribonuclease VII small subunit [Candidatus Parcubacteria bacterium]HOC53438.1 exodeoxyribonuclease VII small subunit [Candidatus Pacearchaeota archaeon]HQM24314.1 exodeoxyribonuclease VII small subunit [Candidatus Pacearchaeota archaeon]